MILYLQYLQVLNYKLCACLARSLLNQSSLRQMKFASTCDQFNWTPFGPPTLWMDCLVRWRRFSEVWEHWHGASWKYLIKKTKEWRDEWRGRRKNFFLKAFMNLMKVLSAKCLCYILYLFFLPFSQVYRDLDKNKIGQLERKYMFTLHGAWFQNFCLSTRSQLSLLLVKKKSRSLACTCTLQCPRLNWPSQPSPLIKPNLKLKEGFIRASACSLCFL